MRTNVKSYTDSQLLERVEYIGGRIPNRGKYLIIGVQSQEDAPNLFDDKFYVYDGSIFKQVSSGTTNAGKTALLHFDQYNLTGAAVWKTDQWCPNLYKRGYHKASRADGGMRALRQQQPIWFYRDSDKDLNAEEVGTLHHKIIWANMHGVSYDPNSEITKELINGWSFACQAWNIMVDYRQMINATWTRNKLVDYALLKEW